MAVSSKRSTTMLPDTVASKFSDMPLGSGAGVFPFCGSSGASSRIGGCRYESGRVSSWIEAMRASSPTRNQRPDDEQSKADNKQSNDTTNTDSNDDDQSSSTSSSSINKSSSRDEQYSEWLKSHPSALESFAKVMEGAERKKIAVFLDYDGTLSPIVENPDQAFMSDESREAVRLVATHFPTAIISGRGRDKVKNFVQLSELYYAGSHGMDIMGPVNCSGVTVEGTRAKDDKGNDVVLFQPASEFLPMMDEVFALLTERAKDIPGASVENNTFCITIHFRRVQEESWHLLAEAVQNVMKDYPKLKLTQGRKVLEVRPCIEWDKGKAVEYLLHLLGLEDSNSLPIYIGDDRTDEDAFEIFQRRQLGCGILVSRVAKTTGASFSLRDPSEVKQFLHTLVQWCSSKKDSSADHVVETTED